MVLHTLSSPTWAETKGTAARVELVSLDASHDRKSIHLRDASLAIRCLKDEQRKTLARAHFPNMWRDLPTITQKVRLAQTGARMLA